jgi:CRP-like cAMP-binding protein
MTRTKPANLLTAEATPRPRMQAVSFPTPSAALSPAAGKIETRYCPSARSRKRVCTSELGPNLLIVPLVSASGCVSQAPLFRGLSREQQAEIASTVRHREFGRRQTIFREDDPVRWVFVIASGRVKTIQLSHGGKEVIIRLEGSGEVLDGLALSPGRVHSLGAQTIEPCHLFKWQADTFHDFVQRFAGLRGNIVEILSTRLETLQERFRDMATERVCQRLARLLIRLFDQSPAASNGGRIGLSSKELPRWWVLRCSRLAGCSVSG